MTVVMLAMIFATKLEFLGMGGNGAMMSFAAAIVFPSIILWVAGGILPSKARLYCGKCDKVKYVSPPKVLDNRIARVSE